MGHPDSLGPDVPASQRRRLPPTTTRRSMAILHHTKARTLRTPCRTPRHCTWSQVLGPEAGGAQAHTTRPSPDHRPPSMHRLAATRHGARDAVSPAGKTMAQTHPRLEDRYRRSSTPRSGQYRRRMKMCAKLSQCRWAGGANCPDAGYTRRPARRRIASEKKRPRRARRHSGVPPPSPSATAKPIATQPPTP